MLTVYAICAVVGMVLLLCQLVMTVMGFDGHGDMDAGDVHGDFGGLDGADGADGGVEGHDSSSFFGILSFRSLVAATAFFGLAGLAAANAGMSTYATLVIALGAGAAAMFVVAWLMRLLYSLHAEGNVRIEQAVGMPGKVYLTIPANRESAGKVTVKVQNRTMEYLAYTDKGPLPTGTPVVVTGIVGSDTVEVEKA